MKKVWIGALSALVLIGAAAPAADAKRRAAARQYVVAYEKGASLAQARRAARSIGGRVVATRAALRIMLVRSSRAGFQRAALRSAVLKGAVRNRAIARTRVARASSVAGKPDPIEKEGRGNGGGKGGVTLRQPAGGLVEPLADWQWDMRMIDATPADSPQEQAEQNLIRE